MEGKLESLRGNKERTKQKSFCSCSGGTAVGVARKAEDTHILKASGSRRGRSGGDVLAEGPVLLHLGNRAAASTTVSTFAR